MEQQERNGVNGARYAALELLEAELRDGNRIDAEIALAELRAMRAAGTVPWSFGEARGFWERQGAIAKVVPVDAYGMPLLSDVLTVEQDALAAGESGLWGLVELEPDPRAMVS